MVKKAGQIRWTRLRSRDVLCAGYGILCLMILLLPSQPVRATAALVQSATSVTNGGTSVSATFGSNPTANNLLIAICGARDSVTITGPSGFSTAINQSGTPSQAIFYKISAGTENALSCTSGSSRLGIHIYEYEGIDTVSPLDAVNAAASTGSSASPASGSVTTTTADTLIIASITTNANTAFSSWSNSFNEVNDFANGGQASSRSTYGGASQLVGSTGVYSTVASAGGSDAWRGQIAAFKIASTGVLSVDVVDSDGSPVTSPSASMGSLDASLDCQTATGTLGTSSERIRLGNMTANGNWSLTIAATGGATASWSNGSNSYDFNDASGSPAGCSDGGDADSLAGQLTINASAGTVTPQSGCASTGVSKGASTAFAQSSVDSITLMSASGSQTNCYFDLMGVALSQKIPGEVPASGGSSYTINLTLTVTAN